MRSSLSSDEQTGARARHNNGTHTRVERSANMSKLRWEGAVAQRLAGAYITGAENYYRVGT